MKKLLILAILLLGLASTSYAISIPEAEDPANGPAVWTVPVYNNSGGSLAVGSVVVWDIDSSTGDNDNWVTTTTTVDTSIVAGVVYSSAIAAASYGLIAVHGVVPVTTLAGHLSAVKGLACSSGTAGSARSCTTNASAFGIVTTANTGTSTNVFLTGVQ